MSWKKFNQNCPCNGCDQRSGNCHDSCAGYMAWAEEQRKKQSYAVPVAEAYTLAKAAKRREIRLNKK